MEQQPSLGKKAVHGTAFLMGAQWVSDFIAYVSSFILVIIIDVPAIFGIMALARKSVQFFLTYMTFI